MPRVRLRAPGLVQAAGRTSPVECPGLVSYDSAASRTRPHPRDIAWHRENAVVALER